MSDAEDEYDEYDLSEFTAEDFVQLDASVSSHLSHSVSNVSLPSPRADPGPVPTLDCVFNEVKSSTGGPAITIEIELATNAPVEAVVAEGASAKLESAIVEAAGSTKEATEGLVGGQGTRQASPYKRHRRGGTLSVSDLVGPAWCEVQFDYGLRQKRSTKLERRPASFVSGEGKTIVVEKKVAAANDVVSKRGRSVHKALEREIHPEPVRVDVKTDAERWALRLVNLIASANSLIVQGCAREVPVFGVVHGQVVVGIIDELQRVPLPVTAQTKQSKRVLESSHGTPESKKRRTPSPSQAEITSFFPASPSPRKSSKSLTGGRLSTPPPHHVRPSNPNYILRLLDAKTRKSNTLPSVEDSLSSRMQLMMYHRLFTNLLSLSPAFNLDGIWSRLRLDPSRPLSAKFLQQAGLILDTGQVADKPSCLRDLERAWRHSVEALDVSGVHPELQLIYRTQPKSPKGKRRRKKSKSKRDLAAQEELDVARAIQMSLDVHANENGALSGNGGQEVAEGSAAASSSSGVGDTNSANLQESDSFMIADDLADDPDFAQALQDSANVHLGGLPTPKTGESRGLSPSNHVTSPKLGPRDTADESSEGEDQDASKVIGEVRFMLDSQALDLHVIDILQWWYGERPPRGVTVAQSGRCFSCEYANGCEWREKKAEEFRLEACRMAE